MVKKLTNYQNVARRWAVEQVHEKYPEMSLQEVADIFSFKLTAPGVYSMTEGEDANEEGLGVCAVCEAKLEPCCDRDDGISLCGRFYCPTGDCKKYNEMIG